MTQGESSGPIRLIFVAAAADYVGVSAMRTLLPFIAGPPGAWAAFFVSLFVFHIPPGLTMLFPHGIATLPSF